MLLNRLNISLNSSQASSVRISMMKSFMDIPLHQACCGPFSFWVWKILNIHDDRRASLPSTYNAISPVFIFCLVAWCLGEARRR
jgi:hypothetical protein